MTIIYSNQTSTRLIYALNFVFNSRGLHYELTTDIHYFKQALGTKLNYSDQEIEGIPFLSPSSLLFENDIRQLSIDKVPFGDFEIMSFDTLPDILASIFFVLSRYEEYWQTERDSHDRFPGICSMQSVYGWLEIPICDLWAEALIGFIGVEEKRNNAFQIQPTFDIDSTYAYREKGFSRNFAGLFKDLLHGRYSRIKERWHVWNKKQHDPFDTFHKILEVVKSFPNTHCFWLLADYSPFNKNLPFNNPTQKEIIQTFDQQCKVGIHPGYDTYLNPKVLGHEKERLEKITQNPVKFSRQHFLRLKLPETYNILLEQKIEFDFSMGYAELPGFRMGTARLCPWFNLQTNTITELQLQPFCYMDGTLNEYLKLSPHHALEEIESLKNAVKKHGGTFSFIWHNETMGFNHHWQGWECVFEKSIK